MSAPRGRDRRARTMVTPEGIALAFTLASRGARLSALLLDLFFIVLAMVASTLALAYVAGGLTHLGRRLDGHDATGEALQFLVIVWLALLFLARNAWFLAFELGPRGATPGKRLSGIRVAARDGGRLSAEMVIARNLLRDVELFVPLVLLGTLGGGGDNGMASLAALAWLVIFAGLPLFNGDRLRPGDIIAGTWVVEAPRRRLEAVLSVAPPPPRPVAGEGLGAGAAPAAPAYRFGEAELAVYGEFELQTLERVLRDSRPEPMLAVAEAICARIGWVPPGADAARPFLEAYYTQLRARLEAGLRMGKRKADKFTGEG